MFRKIRRWGKQLVVDAYNICFNRACGQVVMLHRIGPKEPDRLRCLGELRVSVESLQRFLDERRKFCDFVSLDEMHDRICNPSRSNRPFVCVTIDDGFRDNLAIGLPFFEKNEIPFAVFLTTDFINRHPAFNYPFILERMIVSNDEMLVGGRRYECQTEEQKNAAFVQMKGVLLKQPYDGFESRFEDMFSDYLSSNSCCEDLTLTWNEVAVLASSPLCTIGSHTMTHCRLSNLSKSELELELGKSKLQIEEVIGKKVKFVSYPFGWTTDVNELVFEVAKEVGYEMGFVSHGGDIRKHDADLFKVKRIMFVEDE